MGGKEDGMRGWYQKRGWYEGMVSTRNGGERKDG